MTERAKPFVAWMAHQAVDGTYRGGFFNREGSSTLAVPVVVTPLLPDDPRPGETWLDEHDRTVEILGPVTVDREGDVWVEGSRGVEFVANLRRHPVLKTFRLRCECGTVAEWRHDIQAESREAAVKKLAESLEEVAE